VSAVEEGVTKATIFRIDQLSQTLRTARRIRADLRFCLSTSAAGLDKKVGIAQAGDLLNFQSIEASERRQLIGEANLKAL